MVTEYLSRRYPRTRCLTRVRLGSPKGEALLPGYTPEERRAVSVWRRWADALVLLEDRVILIEAAIRPEPGDISKLELYRLLLPHTPELEAHKHKRIEMVLLYAIEDPATIYLARTHDIRCIHYEPLWLPSYLRLLYPRERRGTPLRDVNEV